MEIKILYEFICLAKHLNFRRAAKHLYIAQPVLSRHIANLENELGVQLFIRDKHSVQLTEIGKVVLEEAEGIVARYEEGLKKINLAIVGLAGDLKIGFLEAAVRNFFPKLVVNFQRLYPNIELHMNQFNLETLTNAIVLSKIDLGFTLSYTLTNLAGLNWKKVYTEDLCVVLRKDHPFSGRDKINLAELAHETFIIGDSSGGSKHILELCTYNGFSPNVVTRSSFPENVLLMVETGIGIAILPRHIKIYSRPELCFVNIEGDHTTIDVVIAWKSDNTNPAIQLFLDEVDKIDIGDYIQLRS